MLMEWSPSLSVEVGQIDAEHRGLVNTINELHDAMLHAKGKEVIGGIIERLARYAVHHFATEEKLMQQAHYPGYALHKAEHDAFVKKVAHFKEEFGQGKVMLTTEVINYLKEWLKHHIMETDKKYTQSLHAAGVH